MNARPVDVLRGAQFAPTPWRDVRVGDVVRVRDREAFPADLVLLSTSAMGSGGGSGSGSGNDGGNGGGGLNGGSDGVGDVDDTSSSSSSSLSVAADPTNHQSQRRRQQQQQVPTGVAYVETANLDGETNLKMRQALPQTAELLSAAAVCRATVGGGGGGIDAVAVAVGTSGANADAATSSSSNTASSSSSPSPPRQNQPSSRLRIECEQPNSAIYRFQGVLVTPSGERLPLSPNQVIIYKK